MTKKRLTPEREQEIRQALAGAPSYNINSEIIRDVTDLFLELDALRADNGLEYGRGFNAAISNDVDERDALKVENEELKAIAKQNKETWTPLAKELCDARKEKETLKNRLKELEDLDYYLEDNKDLMDDLALLEQRVKDLKKEGCCPCGSETSKGCSVTGCPLIKE